MRQVSLRCRSATEQLLRKFKGQAESAPLATARFGLVPKAEMQVEDFPIQETPKRFMVSIFVREKKQLIRQLSTGGPRAELGPLDCGIGPSSRLQIYQIIMLDIFCICKTKSPMSVTI